MEWNADDSDMIRPILGDQEQLLWVGRPITKVRFQLADVSAALLGLGIGMLPLAYFLAKAFESENTISVTGLFRTIRILDWIIVALVTLVGLCFAFMKKALNLHWMKHTYYAVTNMRVLVLSTFPRRKVESRKITPKLRIKKRINKKGFGSLAFGIPDEIANTPKWLSTAITGEECWGPIEFNYLSNAKSVCSLVSQQIDTSSAEPGSNGIELDLSDGGDVFPFIPDTPTPIADPPREVPLICKLTVVFSKGAVWVGWLFLGISTALFWAAVSASDLKFTFTFTFLGIGLLIVATGLIGMLYQESMRTIRLLEVGEASYGSLKSSKGTCTDDGDDAFYDMVFVFKAGNGKEYRAETSVQDTSNLTDQLHELILYNPAKPSENVLLDSIAGRPQIDDSGRVQIGSAWIGLIGFLYVLGLMVTNMLLIVSHLHG